MPNSSEPQSGTNADSLFPPGLGACSCTACRGGGILGQPQARRKRDTPTATQQLTRSRKDVLDCQRDDHPAERRESKSGRKSMFRSVAAAVIACVFAFLIPVLLASIKAPAQIGTR